MKASDLVKVLRELPEYRLRLVELTWKVTRGGSIDPGLVAFHSKEIAEAIAEAEAYRDATREAVRCLMDHFQS
jgi:hypothetical protein